MVGEYVYNPMQIFIALEKWVEVPVQYIPALQKLKGKWKRVNSETWLTNLKQEIADLA